MAQEYDAALLEKFDAANPVSGAIIAKRPLVQPGSGEVLVKMRYAGVNPSDVFSLMGVYPGFTSTLPAVPGFDGRPSKVARHCSHGMPPIYYVPFALPQAWVLSRKLVLV
jgi:D-arabinose 1-dehydrogenase-like Zn-dependent alcohol dehydrogenase